MTSMLAVTAPAAFTTALLDIAHSRQSIYEHSRMSGENRHRRRVLPVDSSDNASNELENAYARSMASYFGETAIATTPQGATVSNQQKTLDAALLQLAHSNRSIYHKTRMEGENGSAHCTLPTDHKAEQVDACSDSTDRSYENAMANYFVSRNVSRL